MVETIRVKAWPYTKTVFGVTIATACLILILELILRPVAYFTHDKSLYYLQYGVHDLSGRVGISPWHVYDGSYYKFPPNYLLRGAAGQGSETALTNALGFRGPDFQPEKPAKRFRIFSLGGSSTFGYHNADTDTYPIFLQDILRSERKNAGVEVINAGFPYYNTSSILALLQGELLGYSPDLVTIYSAYNDASWPVEIGPLFRIVTWVQQRSIIYLTLKETILTDLRVYKALGKLQRNYPSVLDLAARRRDLDEDIEKTASRYRANLTKIVQTAKEHDIAVILVKQPMTTAYGKNEIEGLLGVSYEEEFDAVRQRLEQGEFPTAWEQRLLKHHRLLQVMEDIAERERLAVVDNVAIVDEDRRRLASHVHLTKEANRLLAQALARAIESYIAAAEARN